MFDEKELSKIKGPENVGSDAYDKTIALLQQIRERNKDVKFAYILRKTDDPNTLTFVADADSLHPYEKIDLNQDGKIDESDQLNAPGDEYDVSEFPTLKEFGFVMPTVDDELAVDQWGTFLSSSSPIWRKDKTANEFIGIDVEVSDYLISINAALRPYIFFTIFLIVILTTQTVILVRMWGTRVNLLKELDRQKDELISIVAHQLGTPVTSVKWYIEMLIDGDIGKLTGEQQKQMKTMHAITVNLSDLVSMILDVSRLQLGKMKVDRTDLNLQEFFGEIVAIMDPKAEEKEIKFVKSLPKDMPTAMLDKRLMRMTLENLLSNAIKYTPTGGEVDFKVTVKDGKLSYVVRDTGCGIPKADQGRMFEKLFRATNVRKVDGNGFGLFVAKGAVEAQGGSIRFESEENKGTTFFVELSLKIATEQDLESQKKQEKEKASGKK
ncbi:hypothetical protein A3A67_04895 [Candidatus Peribacteria bacterium RIFCSPLOWO2_01_FULL_51_18]|nr:MAG: hypothetical protein A3A67_04895 [Candidatus Peribacteria bacterium RIFCSPLOWO2_01_FULL_51_18]